MKKLLVLSFFAVLILTACPSGRNSTLPPQEQLENPLQWGDWRAFLYPDSTKKEINLVFRLTMDGVNVTLTSGDFSLQDNLVEKGDSIFMRFNNAEIRCKRFGDSELEGICTINNKKIKFAAYYGYPTEFKTNQRDNLINIDGLWDLRWDSLGGNYKNFSSVKIVHFERALDLNLTVYNGSDSLYGHTGLFDGNRLKSSYFDGKQAFIWEGRWKSATEIKGVLWETDSLRGAWTLTKK